MAVFSSLLVPGAWLLASCGFHLRGPVVLPASMSSVKVMGADPRGELVYEIDEALTESGSRVVGAEEQAGAVIQLTGERFQRVVASVDAKGRVSQYELRYTLSAALRQTGAVGPTTPATVVVRKLLDADTRNALGTSGEQELLEREMRRDGVRQLLRQLRNKLAPQPAPASDKAPDETPR